MTRILLRRIDHVRHLPPDKILYNGNGTSAEYAQDVLERRDEPPKNRVNRFVIWNYSTCKDVKEFMIGDEEICSRPVSLIPSIVSYIYK